MAIRTERISSTFIWRRIHSLMGLWLILYLMEHLIVNSQAALWIGDDGNGFVRLVNSLESLPYLQVIETVFIGIPLVLHGGWGIQRALTAKTNSIHKSDSQPHLSFKRNRAFTWQRLTSWILLVGIAAHVVQMRFLQMPKEVEVNYKKQYLTTLTFDEGLLTLAPRLNVRLFTKEEIKNLKLEETPQEASPDVLQRRGEEKKWIVKLSSLPLKENEVVAAASSPGKAMLLMVRDTFKSPLMMVLYTVFVIAAAFHAFNGFWTSLITWGAILSYRSQKAMLPIAWAGMALLSFLGLAAIWGSYLINLRT